MNLARTVTCVDYRRKDTQSSVGGLANSILAFAMPGDTRLGESVETSVRAISDEGEAELVEIQYAARSYSNRGFPDSSILSLAYITLF